MGRKPERPHRVWHRRLGWFRCSVHLPDARKKWQRGEHEKRGDGLYHTNTETVIPFSKWSFSNPDAGTATSRRPRSRVGSTRRDRRRVRADVMGSASVRQATAGGLTLLNRSAFQTPGPGLQGASGRNALASPGLYNLDASLSRSLALPRLGEMSRITLRCDFFNLLNHANLGQPANQLGLDGFGTARFGRQGSPSSFPALLPFQERGRQVQLLLRLEF